MFGSTLTLCKWVTKLFSKQQMIKIDFKSMLGSIKKDKKSGRE